MSAQNELNQLNEKADPIRYLRATLEDYADILTVAEPFTLNLTDRIRIGAFSISDLQPPCWPQLTTA